MSENHQSHELFYLKGFYHDKWRERPDRILAPCKSPFEVLNEHHFAREFPLCHGGGKVFSHFRLRGGGNMSCALQSSTIFHCKLTGEGLVMFLCPGSHSIMKMKPGKFFAKYFETEARQPVPAEAVKGFANFCKQESSRYQLSFGTKLQEWLDAYEQGPSSCMNKQLQVALPGSLSLGGFDLLSGEFAALGDRIHPVIAYCSDDFAIATVRDDAKGGEIVARAVCSPARKVHAKCYGDSQLIVSMLKAEGYRFTTETKAWIGCKLNAVPSQIEFAYLMPYLDFAEKVKLVRRASVSYFIVSDDFEGGYRSQSVEGISNPLTDGCFCEGCGDEFEDLNHVDVICNGLGQIEEMSLCDDCYSEYGWCGRMHAHYLEGQVADGTLHRCEATSEIYTERERRNGKIVRCESTGDLISAQESISEDSALVLCFDTASEEWSYAEPEHDNGFCYWPDGEPAGRRFCLREDYEEEVSHLSVPLVALSKAYAKRIEHHAIDGEVVFWMRHEHETAALGSLEELESDSDALQGMLDRLEAPKPCPSTRPEYQMSI